MTKWYFDTIEEAKAAMPGYDAILTTGPNWDGLASIAGKFCPVVANGDLLMFINGMTAGIPSMGTCGWVKAEDSEDPEEVSALDLIPFIEAHASGEKVSCSTGGQWRPCGGVFVEGSEYRIEPRTILVNGFEVPEPMRVAPKSAAGVYTVTLFSHGGDAAKDMLASKTYWCDSGNQRWWLERGICHLTKEAAIAHAKAMLGIKQTKSDAEQ